MIWRCSLRREVAGKNSAVFAADKTANLIVRLQYNVIRAGLRRINLAYSRISLADVAARLGAPAVTPTRTLCSLLLFAARGT